MSARRLRTPFVALSAVLLLSGCAAAVPLEPAADATNEGCAEVSVRLPDVVAEQPERETDAQGTAAWGTPAAVILHCGVEPPGPTTDLCVSVNGVDWIIDETRADEDVYTLTTYGRDPAVEITVDQSRASGTSAVTDLANAVSYLPQDRECTDVSDTDTLDTTGTPTG
ncbi:MULTISPECIES: DUF3515 domain-containing protein [unclassified Rathayibacter]|uniref:DUF3515 domain-containing protein n=1 Tax=unclassified Rathayibacter TaxID=2609250 RepID=UPI0006F838E9|nr:MULTISPECIES: DUF3515 domain-containing protein [unclassified Rathayibacter]KQQ00837.1 hypothetical protein ASF42_16125 [Rathayibacter sp. Leaf294]KQS10241.1 hypothetical protein ASG06_16125 [Rathayibacter sp. Leaf185]